MSTEILEKRKQSWNLYLKLLSQSKLVKKHIELPAQIPKCEHTGHIFYILLKDELKRTDLVLYLRDKGIMAFPHYTPLHLSEFGKIHGAYLGGEISKKISQSLIRLPLHSTISNKEIKIVVSTIETFFLA
jgi:dTDP-4-amino-4,6-dideoxygalactose transaminase